MSTTWSICASVMTSGGHHVRVSAFTARVSTPAAISASRTAKASWSGVSLTAPTATSERTSASRPSAAMAPKPSKRRCPTTAARSTRPSSFRMRRLASAAAHAVGWPE